MRVEQYVMAYRVEQDRLRAILPQGFISLRPVLRINAEIINETNAYLEFNTAIQSGKTKGWLNIAILDDISFKRTNNKVIFKSEDIEISFEPVGIIGSCPAEKDNDGTYFGTEFKRCEKITSNKEFCNCEFVWNTKDGTSGKSIGKTLPALPEEVKIIYPKKDFTFYNVASIPCKEVLGSYFVKFDR
ncbi:MAG: hypothetical protein IKJ68_00435 [Clostridia bacterium]|nr:hypothetical protein [Clostridia bacterium]